ncbi:MAG: hypothetical protein ACHQT7_00655 [Candidatus Levyibacteriota bacterium]
MRRRRKYFPILFLGMLSLFGLLLYVFFLDPNSNLTISNFSVSPILLFFILLFGTVCFCGSFLLLNIRRGILLALLVCSVLLLRLFGFTSYIYIIILLIIILLLELGFRKH